MIEFVFIRHGQTNYNRDRRYLGQTDVPLNDEGIKQAEELKSHLSKEKFDSVFCSDLTRCKQTASILAFDSQVQYSEKLREINFGVMEGLTIDELNEQNQEVIENYKKNWFDYKIPEGESFREVKKRIISKIEDIRQDQSGKIAIVTHGGCIRTALAHYIADHDQAFWKFYVDNAAVTRIVFDGSYCYLSSFNEK